MQEIPAPPGRGPKALRFFTFGIVLVIVAVVAGAFLSRNSAALALLRSVAHGFGYNLTAGAFDVGPGQAVANDVHIRTAAGEPVLDARRVDIHYSLRDLLPGGKRLFGLTAVDITAPHVTVIHHANGSYNIVIPKTAPRGAQPNPPPLDVRFRVTDGSVDLVDEFVAAPRERRTRFSAIHADGVVSPASGSYYYAGATFEDGAARYPILGAARFDDPRGFELQHWTAAKLPVAPLANFGLSTHAIEVQAGEIRNLDLKLGALSTPEGDLQSHLGISAELTGGRVAASALTRPIRNARGSFVVDDDSATVRSLDADLNGLPLHLSGALYHFAAPQIAFALTARGDLNRARALSKESAKLPLAGALALQGLAEGAATSPTVFVRFRSPHVDYGTYRLDAARGFVALSGNELDVIDAAIRYGPADLTGRAAVLLAQHTQTTAYGTLTARASDLPYAGNLLPGILLRGIAVASGTDGKLAARGYLGGVNGSDRLDAPFAIAASGSGSVGPVVLQRRDGASVYARATIDRAANQTVALVDVHQLSLLPAPAVALPGVTLPAVPKNVDAKLDAALTGVVTGTTLANASGELHAFGSWGDLRATADGSAAGLAARGRLTSSFERLAPFTGNIGARGGIDIPFLLANAGRSTTLQIVGAQFPHAVVRGIALQGLTATLGVAPPVVNVYAADLRVGGHDVTAAGRFGAGGRVHVTAGDLDLQPARAAGVPISGGRATVLADLGGTLAKPTATVLAALTGARYAGTDVGGDIGLGYDGATLRIDRATLTYAGAYANATGAVSGLVPGHIAPHYAVRAHLEDADIATLARTVKNPLRYPEGTLDADLRVGGAGAAPSVRGEVKIPEGSLNGLNFSAARIGVDADRTSVTASGGRVTVGSTNMTFAGSASRLRQRATLRSDRIDLADFDDYFDEAEVLAGRGHAALAVDASPRALNVSADVALQDTRYRRFDLGSVTARVATAGTMARINATVAGSNGTIGLAGSVNLPATDPLRDLVRRSNVDLQTQIAGLNLGTVLPAAGLSVPLLGIVDGSAAVRGRYPALSLSAHAALSNGAAGRIPIERFTVAANAAGGRGRLTDLELVAPGLTANATGSFGFRPDDALDLTAHAMSTDINLLVTTATGKSPGLRGSLASTAHVTGTLAQPRLASSVDATNVAYSGVTIPAVHADLAATRAAVDIKNGSITLPLAGAIAFDGHAPLGGAISTTPLALDFAPHHVDVQPYSLLLGDGSVVQGIFDGNVGLRGTIAAPRLSGSLAFTRGSYRSNRLTSPLTDLTLNLDFSGTGVQIARLHAHAAPGNIDGTGRLALRDLSDPVRGLTANVDVTLAGARIAAPKYYTGTIDGTLTARKRVAAPAIVGGNLTFSSARIPYTALLPSGGSSTGAAPALPNIGFDLGVNVARDVRVQSGPVDIGTTGMAQLGGTLAKPTLRGKFTATDGTVSLYRTFTVQNGSAVTFDPADGITPSVDATAVTNVPDPPTDVLLHVTGPSTQLHLAFSSEPSYSQQQILGLLVNAQALGAVSGVAQSGSTTNGVSIAGLGEGVFNTQLTQKFLQPFSSSLGNALGLSDLNLNYNLNGGVSANLRRKLGKNISFVYGAEVGGPTPQTSFGINVGTAISGGQLTFFQSPASQQPFANLTPYQNSGFLANSRTNYTLQSISPPTGSGFVASYQRHFW